jgi:CobQ-like glutamine amidotransferase family enzyme
VSAPTLDLLVLYPGLLDLGADSANAAVLRVRAGWEGIDARVETLQPGQRPPASRPDFVVVGSAAEEDLFEAATALLETGNALHHWVEAGTVLLAVGSGLDLLADHWEVSPGYFVPGAGVFGGRAWLLDGRASGDLVASSAHGRLVGYENHARGYDSVSGEQPLGQVDQGVGNGDSHEGVVRGVATGTHLHGPFYARNPTVADEALDRMMQARHGVRFTPASDEIRRADALARRIVGG